MSEVFICGESAITSLGFSIEEQISKIAENFSGVQLIDDGVLAPEPFYASVVNWKEVDDRFSQLGDCTQFTRFEKICILSVHSALERVLKVNVASSKTIFIVSTTKGNIDLLDQRVAGNFHPDRKYLWKASEVISRFFNNSNTPVVVSNACISGVLAISTAHDLLQAGIYDHAVVVGGDIATEFVVSGFQSFKSLSFGVCKPFDAHRDGLNLGEGAGCVVLTRDKSILDVDSIIRVLGGASSNDANHISGPSRTGDGLLLAVNKALFQSGVSAQEIDFISAHGTATPFNDEMESKAFAIAGLSNAPLNSFKAYFGHTLGAAGIIESVFATEGMKRSLMFATMGFKDYGVPEKVTINTQLLHKEQRYLLKTASGFGGCNAAVVFSKF